MSSRGWILIVTLVIGSPVYGAGRWSGPMPELISVPAGSFQFAGQLNVSIKRPFAVGKTEVTFAQWDACVADRGCDYRPDDNGWGRGDRPVMFVSWDDALQYTQWLSRKTGRHFRLPTETEWEYLARAGTTTRYYWGADGANICQYASVVSGSEACGEVRPGVVGTRNPNAWGLYDTAGSVWEWVADCWHADAERAPTNGNAFEARPCRQRVLRGGAWNFTPEFAQSDSRSYSAAALRFDNYGFRVAVTL
jgi:formylglycine-generating enzyme required for sulfatase activity